MTSPRNLFGRRFIMGLAALSLCAAGQAVHAQAGDYPNRPVTLVVPFPPGGGTDTSARLIATRLSQKWGKSVIVDNKGGAAGMIGADFVAKAKGDGYTLLFGNIGTQAINPSLYKSMPYAPDTAFAPVSLVAELPLVMMVNAQVPAKTVEEFIALAKTKPDGMSYSTSGAGSSMHLAAEMFKSGSGTAVQHVPYRGGGPAVGDLLAGHVQLCFATVLESSAHLAAFQVPTLAEGAIPGFDSISWVGLLAPAGTPREITDKISADIRQVLALDEVKARLAELGALPVGSTPDAFAKLIASDRKRYAQIIADKNIHAD